MRKHRWKMLLLLLFSVTLIGCSEKKDGESSKSEHDGASDSNADYHLVRILHIGDVRGQTRHQTGRRKAVNIGKRKTNGSTTRR